MLALCKDVVETLWIFCAITQLLHLVLAQHEPKTSSDPSKLGEQRRYKRGLVLDPIGFSVDFAVAHSLSWGRRRWDGAESKVTAGRSL